MRLPSAVRVVVSTSIVLTALAPAPLAQNAAPQTPAEKPAQTPPAGEKPAPNPGEGRLEPWQQSARLDSLPALAPREMTRSEVDARARAAFAALAPNEQQDVLDWFDVECEKLKTFQLSLVTWAKQQLGATDKIPAIEPLTWYDAKTHAPAQPITRVPLDPNAPAIRAVRHKLLSAAGGRAADSGWMYDYAKRELRRLPNEADKLRVLENALLGLPQGWDLAEAWVESKLDDGSLQKTFVAFDHAYTDRNGGVYAGLTLYDAHASRGEIQMPDVDALGLVHELTNDWKTWTAVVPDSKQASLYAKVGELFTPAHRHRALRTNIARTFLCGTTELRDKYQHNLDNFHWLWESVSSDPNALAKKLPDAAGWAAFLDGVFKELQDDPAKMVKAFQRHKTLDLDMLKVRDALLWVLNEFGAFEKLEPLPKFR